jgi:flagellar biosynthesis/type III secretory pathway protein FliH
MTAPTTANEVQIRVMFDEFWDEVKFRNLSMDYRLKSLIETIEEDLVLEFEGLMSASEIREQVQEAYDDGYDKGHEEGSDSEAYDRDSVYDEGFKEGYENGHSEGYDQALMDNVLDG